MSENNPQSLPSLPKFGTDGWRAVVAEDYTYDNVKLCARALGLTLLEEGEAKRVTVGYDTRFCSDSFARAAADELASIGLEVHLFSRPAPTPACSFFVVASNSAAGAMITASHNPPEWNGFKVRTSSGGSAPPEFVRRIEANMPKAEKSRPQPRSGGFVREFDPMPEYLDAITHLPDMDAIKSSRMDVITDAMHGSGGGILPKVLAGGNLIVSEMRGEPNPAFPGMKQPEPIGSNLLQIAALVKETGADVGLALDGDADRLGVIDETGRYLSTLDVFSLLTYHLMQRKNLRGGVACTITMSAMVDRICESFDQPVCRTPVGFKYVGPAMIANDSLIAGEESGGYAFRGHVPERDGSLSALMFLEAMAISGKKPSELLEELHNAVGRYYFHRVDTEFARDERGYLEEAVQTVSPSSLGGIPVTGITRLDGVRFELNGKGWVAARMSGTEPLIRVYAEMTDDKGCRAAIADLNNALKRRKA